jgi:hypothetical protein
MAACATSQVSSKEGTLRSKLLQSVTTVEIFCELCHRPVSMVDQAWADRLSALEGKGARRRAYECHFCEALIFEDEMENGRFVPRQPRRFWS